MKKQMYINLIAQTIAYAVNLGISFFLTPYIVNHIGVEANGFVGLANNFISSYLLSAHLESNLVNTDGYTPYTLKEKSLRTSRED